METESSIKITRIKVKRISVKPNEDVYDISVKNNHNFFANGILIHNCFEISFTPITDDGICGVQFCNLSSINGVKIDSEEKFMKAVKAATILGTLQASYTTDMKYLSKASKQLTEDESLLGVSITGIMDNPNVLLNKEIQKKGAEYVIKINREWSTKIGIKPAARVTCVKPEGTSSLVLSSASGIHPHHSHRYFRRIQCNKHDNVFKFVKQINPHMCEESLWSANKTDEIVTFPLSIPETSMVKEDLSAIQHLEYIKSTQENWVNIGSKIDTNKKNITNNVSCTVLVKDEEWKEVIKFIYDNRSLFSAVALLPYVGDKLYKQAPMESITTKEDEEKWNNLVSNYKHMDFKKLEEDDDDTSVAQNLACSGNKCEIF